MNFVSSWLFSVSFLFQISQNSTDSYRVKCGIKIYKSCSCNISERFLGPRSLNNFFRCHITTLIWPRCVYGELMAQQLFRLRYIDNAVGSRKLNRHLSRVKLILSDRIDVRCICAWLSFCRGSRNFVVLTSRRTDCDNGRGGKN